MFHDVAWDVPEIKLLVDDLRHAAKPHADDDLWSAGDEYPKVNVLGILDLREKSKNQPDVIIRVAFIQCIDNNVQRGVATTPGC